MTTRPDPPDIKGTLPNAPITPNNGGQVSSGVSSEVSSKVRKAENLYNKVDVVCKTVEERNNLRFGKNFVPEIQQSIIHAIEVIRKTPLYERLLTELENGDLIKTLVELSNALKENPDLEDDVDFLKKMTAELFRFAENQKNPDQAGRQTIFKAIHLLKKMAEKLRAKHKELDEKLEPVRFAEWYLKQIIEKLVKKTGEAYSSAQEKGQKFPVALPELESPDLVGEFYQTKLDLNAVQISIGACYGLQARNVEDPIEKEKYRVEAEKQFDGATEESSTAAYVYEKKGLLEVDRALDAKKSGKPDEELIRLMQKAIDYYELGEASAKDQKKDEMEKRIEKQRIHLEKQIEMIEKKIAKNPKRLKVYRESLTDRRHLRKKESPPTVNIPSGLDAYKPLVACVPEDLPNRETVLVDIHEHLAKEDGGGKIVRKKEKPLFRSQYDENKKQFWITIGYKEVPCAGYIYEDLGNGFVIVTERKWDETINGWRKNGMQSHIRISAKVTEKTKREGIPAVEQLLDTLWETGRSDWIHYVRKAGNEYSNLAESRTYREGSFDRPKIVIANYAKEGKMAEIDLTDLRLTEQEEGLFGELEDAYEMVEAHRRKKTELTELMKKKTLDEKIQKLEAEIATMEDARLIIMNIPKELEKYITKQVELRELKIRKSKIATELTREESLSGQFEILLEKTEKLYFKLCVLKTDRGGLEQVLGEDIDTPVKRLEAELKELSEAKNTNGNGQKCLGDERLPSPQEKESREVVQFILEMEKDAKRREKRRNAYIEVVKLYREIKNLKAELKLPDEKKVGLYKEFLAFKEDLLIKIRNRDGKLLDKN